MKTNKEFIKVRVYYAVIDGKIVIDEESIREEFDYHLKQIMKLGSFVEYAKRKENLK